VEPAVPADFTVGLGTEPEAAGPFWASAALIGLIAFVYAWNPLDAESDFYAHAAIGRWMIQHHQIPAHSLFLWSFSVPWVAHSWLSEILMYRMMATWGPGSAVWFAAWMIAVTFLALFLYGRGRHMSALVPLLFGISILASQPRYLPRPDLFTDLFTVVVLILILEWPRVSRRRGNGEFGIVAAGMTLLFALWANLHGAVISGVAMLAMAGTLDLFQSRYRASGAKLLGLAVIGILAVTLNPYGWHYFSIYQQVDSHFFSTINEWRPVYAIPYYDIDKLFEQYLVAVVALVAWFRTKDRRVSLPLLVIYSLIAFTQARRNALICSLTSLAVIVECAQGIDPQAIWAQMQAAKPRAKLGAAPQVFNASAVSAVVFVLLAAVLFVAPFWRRGWPMQTVEPGATPQKQTDFLIAHGVSGAVYNDYNTAPYLEWRLYGRSTFYIDGMNAYPDSIDTILNHVILADDEGIDYLKRNRVNWFVGRNRDPVLEPDFPPIYHALQASPDWALVYFDYDGPVWVRKVPELRSVWRHTVALPK
jgi:hypothetical protein